MFNTKNERNHWVHVENKKKRCYILLAELKSGTKIFEELLMRKSIKQVVSDPIMIHVFLYFRISSKLATLDWICSINSVRLNKVLKSYKVLQWYLKNPNFIRNGQGVWPELRERPTTATMLKREGNTKSRHICRSASDVPITFILNFITIGKYVWSSDRQTRKQTKCQTFKSKLGQITYEHSCIDYFEN